MFERHQRRRTRTSQRQTVSTVRIDGDIRVRRIPVVHPVTMASLHQAPLERLTALVGQWDLETTSDGRTMSRARVTFGWHRDGGLLVYRADPPSHLVAEWQDAAPQWVDAVIGVDDHTGEFTKLYVDSRGVSRVYRMTLDDRRWTMTSRPGPQFHQRFEADIAADGTAIHGRWLASPDGATWSTDFHITYRRREG